MSVDVYLASLATEQVLVEVVVDATDQVRAMAVMD